MLIAWAYAHKQRTFHQRAQAISAPLKRWQTNKASLTLQLPFFALISGLWHCLQYMDTWAYELLTANHSADQLCCNNIRRTMLWRTCYYKSGTSQALAQKGEVSVLARLNCNTSVCKRWRQCSIIHCQHFKLTLPSVYIKHARSLTESTLNGFVIATLVPVICCYAILSQILLHWHTIWKQIAAWSTASRIFNYIVREHYIWSYVVLKGTSHIRWLAQEST